MVAEGDKKSQREKFEQAARELECDEDEAGWDDRLKKIARPGEPPANPANG